MGVNLASESISKEINLRFDLHNTHHTLALTRITLEGASLHGNAEQLHYIPAAALVVIVEKKRVELMKGSANRCPRAQQY